MKIGFIGLGAMGKGIAINLQKAGHTLTVWNRTPAAADELVRQGAQRAATPGDCCDQADIVFSLLFNDEALRQVWIEGGLTQRLAPEAIHINMATISAAFAAELSKLHQQAGRHYLSVPVMGRPDVAATGKLSLIAGGETALIDRVQPVFDVIGVKTWRVGADPVQANVAKLAMNFMLLSAIEAMAEATSFSAAYDVSPSLLIELASSTVFPGPVYGGYGKPMAQQQHASGGSTAQLGSKDAAMAVQAAAARNVPLPMAALVRDHYLSALAHGEADMDLNILGRVARRRAGQSV